MNVSPPSAPLSPAARAVVEDFVRAFGSRARVWSDDGAHRWGGDGAHDGAGEPVPGWPLRVATDDGPAEGAARFLASTLARIARHEDEIRSFSREMAERYEEINLLYSISEILGSIISLEAAAGTILAEVASILGASRAALWVHDVDRAHLYLAAVEGGDGGRGPVAVDDACSLTAEVFREGRPLILAPGERYRQSECGSPGGQAGPFLSVPVSYTPPDGEARTVGVINLVGRAGGDGFSAGDIKLLSAIASQIGAAVENARLVEESLGQQRMEREMELAHDLQLKLLPPLEQFAGYCEVGARCVPAESVGGDFYHLFRLPGQRLGVMIGDVSSHGFGAALIMALAMSAVAIHASEGDPPAEVLRRTHRALIDELETTEMYLTLFYGVIDPQAGTIAYANAGHSNAYRIGGDGRAERLAVTDPPFGIVDRDTYGEATSPWRGGEDLLLLFTDGLSDGFGRGEEGARALVAEAAAHRAEPAQSIVARVFDRAAAESEAESDVPADDRTALAVRF